MDINRRLGDEDYPATAGVDACLKGVFGGWVAASRGHIIQPGDRQTRFKANRLAIIKQSSMFVLLSRNCAFSDLTYETN